MGKSTLLHIAAGLACPDTGRVNTSATQMGFAFQTPVFLPWKSVGANMAFILSHPSSQKEPRIKALLDRLGLLPAYNLPPSKLSGGMKKRLGLAMSLLPGPDLLFLDEPFAFLDKNWQHLVANDLSCLNQNKDLTIFMASHDLAPARAMGAQILKLPCRPIQICHG
ncbi:MAG: ATP-binding cassette domain-containing protein [Desulfobacter sp.]|nr:ATP-binding cassette domain-containing protein [Desulfobacter sp.]